MNLTYADDLLRAMETPECNVLTAMLFGEILALRFVFIIFALMIVNKVFGRVFDWGWNKTRWYLMGRKIMYQRRRKQNGRTKK